MVVDPFASYVWFANENKLLKFDSLYHPPKVLPGLLGLGSSGVVLNGKVNGLIVVWLLVTKLIVRVGGVKLK